MFTTQKRTINKAFLCKTCYQYQSLSPSSEEVGTAAQKWREKFRITENKFSDKLVAGRHRGRIEKDSW